MIPDGRMAAVVVAYNGGTELVDCVRSLLAQTLPDLEIIVVDNASTDGSIVRAESEFGDAVRVIRRATNGGYAAGANTGWRATDAPIVAILNQDLVMEPGCLEEMRCVLLEETREALVTPKLVLQSDPTRVNAIGNDVHLSCVAWCHGLGTPADDWHGVVEVTAVSGAAFMAKRVLLETLGGLEESYFMYMEDVDLSFRARLAGAVCLAACDAVATHGWALALTPMKFAMLERNRRRVWRSLIGPHRRREVAVLLQAELLGWLYAVMHGRGYVVAKARGARSGRRTTRVQIDREDKRRLADGLAGGLPYSTVFPGVPAVAKAGGIIDRAVLQVAGLTSERRAPSGAPVQRVG